MRPDVRKILPFLAVFLFLPWAGSPRAQFKVTPRSDVYGLESEPRFEFYSPARYNRVEGFFPALGVTLRNRKNGPVALSADAGYGLANKRAAWHAEVSYKPGFLKYAECGISVFDNTFTNDDWLIGRLTNSLAAAFLRKDYYDYFRKRGVAIWFQKEFGETFHVRTELSSASYSSMKNETDWSVFAYAAHFRPNPPVLPGRENRLRVEIIVDQLDNPIFPMQGWYLEAALEQGNGVLGGDAALENTGLFATLKYFHPSWGNQRAVFMVRAGHRAKSRAPQHLLDLGGVGTLRGYGFKEFQNRNTLVYAKVLYSFGGDLLGKLPLSWIPFYRGLASGVFVETGALWDVGYTPPPGERAVDSPQWKWTAGFSISVTGDFLRLNVAKRLDRSTDAWGVTVQLLPKW